MYEEKNKRFFTSDILLLILKLVLLAIFIFILCWLFIGNKGKKEDTLDDAIFKENINGMKDAAYHYFTTDKLPTEIGETVRINLESMIKQKLLLDFTNNGKKCSLKDSYIEATKSTEDNYALKVNLKCGQTENFIMSSIEKEKEACVTCPTVNENNNDKEIDQNNNNNNQVNNSTNSTPSSKPTQNQSQSQSQNEKVVTKVTYKYYCYGTSCKDKQNQSENKDKYYEVYKYSDWQKEVLLGNNVEKKCEDKTEYTYCKTGSTSYYGDCIYPKGYMNKTVNNTFGLYKIDINKFEPYEVKVNSFKSINDYKEFYNSSSSTKLAETPEEMMNATLSEKYYTLKYSDLYIDNNMYRIDLTTTIKDNIQTNYVYSPILKNYFYFITFKIDVLLKEKNTCITDTYANKDKYTDYKIFDKKTTNECLYREKEYKWVKESDLNEYLHNGWIKTGNTK